MHVEIRPGSVATEQKGTSKKTGQPYSIRTQEAWALMGSGEVRKLKLTLNREQAAYAPGVYDIGEESFMVNQFGDLGIGRLSLILRKATVAPARQAG